MSGCRGVERCRGGVGAVSVDTDVGLSGRCRTWCRGASGFLDTAHMYAVSGVSECRAVSSVGVSSSVRRVGCVGCRGVGRCVAVSGGVG